MELKDLWCKIKIGNQQEIDCNDITTNLHFLELDTSPMFSNTYTDIKGVDGSLYNSSQFNKSIVNLKFVTYFKNWNDFDLAKHDIYRTFMTRDVIRVRCNTSPCKVYYCRAGQFNIQIKKVGQCGAVFTIPLDNPSGMAYSLVNSDEFSDSSEIDNWSYGMNIPTDIPLIYHFTNNSFSVYNPSDKRINPYLNGDKLTISIKFNGSHFNLKNHTNGTNWSYNKASNGNDTILLNGVNSSLNNQPCSKDTNFGHIELDQGWNDFTVDGAVSLDVTFSFPFVYVA